MTKAAVTEVVVIFDKLAASVDCSAVMSVVPAPEIVIAVKMEAAPVSVVPALTLKVADVEDDNVNV